MFGIFEIFEQYEFRLAFGSVVGSAFTAIWAIWMWGCYQKDKLAERLYAERKATARESLRTFQKHKKLLKARDRIT